MADGWFQIYGRAWSGEPVKGMVGIIGFGMGFYSSNGDWIVVMRDGWLISRTEFLLSEATLLMCR